MPSESSTATAKEIRKFAVLQLAITTAFLAVVFWMFNEPDANFPPIWFVVALMVAVVIAAFFSERVWLRGTPLDPAESTETNEVLALEAYANQTLRKLIYSEVPKLIAVLACFVGSTGSLNWGGWPVLIVALPGLAVQAYETWPHLRSTSMAAVILDSEGAESRLVENFSRS
jgi:hypothetical protein